jgi:hypothetical protein
MRSFTTANPRRLAIFVFLFVFFSIALVFLARDLIHEMIVLPVAYLLFLARIFIDSTPQVFFWLAVLLISGWIAYRSLYRRRKRADYYTVGHAVTEEPRGGQGRMSFWTTKVNVARRYGGSYFGSGFHLALGRLLIEMLAHRYRMSIGQVEDRIRSRTLDLPPEVEEYLLSSINRTEFQGSRLQRLWQEFLNKLHLWFSLPLPRQASEKTISSALQGIDKVIYYMEEELEVSHEHPGQSSR